MKVCLWLALASIVLTFVNSFYPGWLRSLLISGRLPISHGEQRTEAPAIPIHIVMDGGLIQDIQYIPAGVTVEVFDYDVEGQDDTHPNMTKDGAGERVFVNIWTNGGKTK